MQNENRVDELDRNVKPSLVLTGIDMKTDGSLPPVLISPSLIYFYTFHCNIARCSFSKVQAVQ